MNLKELLNFGKEELNNNCEDTLIILKILVEDIFKIKNKQNW